VYRTKDPSEVSWFQPIAEKSLRLIRESGVKHSDPIIDVGGGASTLVDSLLGDGFNNVTVLDISGAALSEARTRLTDAADKVSWIESDVTIFEPPHPYVLWHDRAVFHFLIEQADRDAYLNVVRRALATPGHLLLATFGPEGPLRCSGLEIRRYGVEQLQEILGEHFELRCHELDQHETPSGSTQQFLFTWWQARA